MLSMLKRALQRGAQDGTGAGNGTSEPINGGSLPQRPVALPPQRHAHTPGAPTTSSPHRHGAHAHNGHGHHGNGASTGASGLRLPARPSGVTQTREVGMLLPPELAKNVAGEAATTVAVLCDKHEGWRPFELSKLPDGGWSGKLPIPESSSWIHYYFLVDGEKIVLDPAANRVRHDQLKGELVSLRQSRY